MDLIAKRDADEYIKREGPLLVLFIILGWGRSSPAREQTRVESWRTASSTGVHLPRALPLQAQYCLNFLIYLAIKERLQLTNTNISVNLYFLNNLLGAL